VSNIVSPKIIYDRLLQIDRSSNSKNNEFDLISPIHKNTDKNIFENINIDNTNQTILDSSSKAIIASS